MKYIDTDISSYYAAYAVPKDFGHKYLTTWIEEAKETNDRFEKEYLDYLRNDIAVTQQTAKELLNANYGSIAARYKPKQIATYTIKNVIFNPPATIVFWADCTKTVVKCGEHDIYDPEKGLAMAFTKKMLGNHGNYYNVFRKWLPREEDNKPVLNLNMPDTFGLLLKEAVSKLTRVKTNDDLIGYLGEALDE